jgi:protoheme IX farnesyltransferase
LFSGAVLLAFLLYAWQFPHFNSLSWNIRREYALAGYKMMCVSHERLCLTTSLRYSIMIFLSCSFIAPAIDMTTWLFAIDTLPINFYLIYLSYKFYRNHDAQSSRKLFRYSLIHLPLLFTLMVIHRQIKSQNHPTSSPRNELIPVPM